MSVESTLTMTPKVMLVLKEFAPRIFQEVMKPESVSSLTVVIYHSVETWAGFVAKTTCSIRDGMDQFKKLTEIVYLEAYQLSMPEKLGMQLVSQTYLEREYRVSTLPLILQRVQNRKQDPLFAGLQADQYPEWKKAEQGMSQYGG